MAAYLGTEGYGVNSQVNTLITFLVPIATLGLGFGIVRIVAGQQSTEAVSSRLYSTILVVGLVSFLLSVVVFLSAPVVNRLLFKVDWATAIIRWSAPLIFLTAFEQLMKDYFRARLRIVAYSIFQIVQTIVYVSGVAIILTTGGGLLELIWLWLGIKVLFNLATFIYFIIAGEIQFRLVFMPRGELINLLRFGFPIVIAGLGTWVTNVGDRWIIGYFMSVDDVGVYNAGYTLAGIITAIASPFWNPLYPIMASSVLKDDKSVLFNACKKYTNGFCLVGIPAVLGLIALANPLLVIIGSDDFSIGFFTFTLIILGLFSDQISATAHYLVYLHNDPGYMRNVTIASGVTNVIINLLTIPYIGITGAALATFASFLLLDFLLFRRVISYGYKIQDLYDLKSLTKMLASAVVMGLVIMILMRYLEMTLATTGVLVLVGGLVYFTALLAVNGWKTTFLSKFT
jgi:O-antigen/teichoic acid export membrane protein